ncbi:MAG TPA: glycosyltransferase [Acidobacteriota bacterium]|nr:glycosyltransferase [Acidobacteriota bacterium]
MAKLKLSTFLILKDEGRTVARALESAAGITDRFVIGIDAASSDGTEEIVRGFAARHPGIEWDIYKFRWENHFARARNRALELCKGDWILQLDGHEYLRSGSAQMVLWYIEHADPEVWLISVMMQMEPDRYGIPDIFFVQHHLWRNGRGVRYVNASHNAIPLEVVPDHRRLRTNDIVIVHQRPRGNAERRREQRRAMNIPNFEQALASTPDDPRSLFYMGQSCVDAGRPGEAVPFYKRYLEVSTHAEEKYEAAVKLGEVEALAGKPEEAAEAFHAALKLIPARAEAPFNLGLVAKLRIEELNAEMLDEAGTIEGVRERQLYLNRLHALTEEAQRWFAIAGSTSPPVTSYFLRGPVYTYLPHLESARLAAALYRYTGLEIHFGRAAAAFRKALEFRPGDPEILAETGVLEEERLARLRAAIGPAGERKRLLVVDATGQFTPPLIERWRADYEVRPVRRAATCDLLWADAVFVDWCDENLVEISRRRWGVPLVCRLWRYEAYSAFPARVNWANVDALIVPAEFLRTWLADRHGIESPVRVIRPGIDLKKARFRERGPGRRVAVAGYLHPRKNLDEVADIAARENIELHLAGRWQGSCIERHFWWRLRRAGAAQRVRFHAWRGDIGAWLDEVGANYMLSASWSESFGFVIAEAMAAGIRPIVKRFEGAEELWPDSVLYDDPADVGEHMAGNYDSRAYRQWVAERCDVEREAAQYLELFASEGCLKGVSPRILGDDSSTKD